MKNKRESSKKRAISRASNARPSFLRESVLNIKYTSEVNSLRQSSLRPEKSRATLGLIAKAQELGQENGGDEEPDNKLAYKDMKDSSYYTATFAFLIVVVVLACIVPNVDIIFDLLSLFAINAICFFFPSSFYLFGVWKKAAREEDLASAKGFKTKRNTVLEICAYLTVAAGVGSFVLGGIDTYNVIKEAIQVAEK